jgi:SAM-dependent methyltransferase
MITSDERLRRRATFNRIADVYSRVRPSLPAAMFDDLAELTGIGAGSRVLEIGCGPGTASLPLAQRGYELLAVELGPQLAALASARLAGHPSASVVVADFDHWTPERPGFDVIFSSTAFHWLDPATRYDRTADLLVPGGSLAVAGTRQIMGGTEQFFLDVQSCYRRYYQGGSEPPPYADQVPQGTYLGSSGRYRKPVFRRYEWDVEYDTADYLALVSTYSATLELAPPVAAGLLRDIGGLIDGRYGGRVTKRYLAELRVAARAD